MGGFTLLEDRKRKWGAVSEDKFEKREGKNWAYLAVADGVSRDPMNNYPDLNTEKGKKIMIKNYPKPSIAKKAAEIAVKSGDLYSANKKIKKFNIVVIRDPDWLKNDLAGCTAAITHVKGDILEYQFIASCGVAVVDVFGVVKFRTEDEYWKTDESRWALVLKAEFVQGFLDSIGKRHKWWSHPEGRLIMRRMFRNKPKQKFSFGVLTGEDEAENYIRKGRIKLREGDVVLVYTDGLTNALFSKTGLELIAKRDFSGLKEYCKSMVNSEGTVVYWIRK